MTHRPLRSLPRRASCHGGSHSHVDLPDTEEAVIQILAARTRGIRGVLAIHCWLVLKPPGSAHYERWEVVGRRARTGWTGLQRNALSPREGWGGRRTHLLLDRRGPPATAALAGIAAAIDAYPHRRHYRAWPGPNCNSFVAYLARSIPALHIALPPLAIGKDFLPGGRLIARAPSGTGWQVSLLGLAGVLVAVEEGLEVGALGLVLGCRPRPLRLLLPGMGAMGGQECRIGLNEPFSPTV